MTETGIKSILGTMTFGDQVDDTESRQMIDHFLAAGNRELDTAFMYCEGETEKLLGRILSAEERDRLSIATKVNPWNDNGLQPEEVQHQFAASLSRLGVESVDLLYLHAPDPGTPVVRTLGACHSLYVDGGFRHLALSNFAAWQVAEVVETCQREGWMKPTVYQGLYNALNRDVESELMACLRHYGIAFYAYNPLAGGFLTGKHRRLDVLPEEGRFAGNTTYQERYWSESYFSALDDFVAACDGHGIAPAEAAIAWLHHHSALSAEAGDGIILGASKLSQLDQNLAATAAGPLPEDVVEALNRGWDRVRSTCFRYFR